MNATKLCWDCGLEQHGDQVGLSSRVGGSTQEQAINSSAQVSVTVLSVGMEQIVLFYKAHEGIILLDFEALIIRSCNNAPTQMAA
eukprot:5993931-Amphidinium_carterae.1